MLPHLHLPTEPPVVRHEPAEPALQSALWLHLHARALHVNPAGHWSPHPPQFAGSLPRSKQPAGPWQHVWFPVHAAPPLHEQALLTQVCPSPHCVPPQLHLPRLHIPPPPHAVPAHRQCPPLHANALGHAFVQPPQCAASISRDCSQPFAALPSQSPDPGGQ